jgi:hypothetical protein
VKDHVARDKDWQPTRMACELSTPASIPELDLPAAVALGFLVDIETGSMLIDRIHNPVPGPLDEFLKCW